MEANRAGTVACAAPQGKAVFRCSIPGRRAGNGSVEKERIELSIPEYVTWMNSLLSDNPKADLLREFLHYLDEKGIVLAVSANPGTDGSHELIPTERTPEQIVLNFLGNR